MGLQRVGHDLAAEQQQNDELFLTPRDLCEHLLPLSALTLLFIAFPHPIPPSIFHMDHRAQKLPLISFSLRILHHLSKLQAYSSVTKLIFVFLGLPEGR